MPPASIPCPRTRLPAFLRRHGLVLVTIAATLIYFLSYIFGAYIYLTSRHAITFDYGSLYFVADDQQPFRNWSSHVGIAEDGPFAERTFYWYPTPFTQAGGLHRGVSVPLWPVLISLIIASAYRAGWRRGYVRARDGACARCFYPLADVPPADDPAGDCTCPECGLSQPTPRRARGYNTLLGGRKPTAG